MSKELIIESRGLDLTAIREVRDAIRTLQDRQRELMPRMVAFGLRVPEK